MKKTKFITILDIISYICRFICMTMLVLGFNLSVLKYTDDITILRAVGLISASMALPFIFHPFKNPGRLGLYTLGFLLATMATSLSKHPATELQAFSTIGFFTLILWEFMARDWAKNIHLGKLVSLMDIIVGTPWWEKEHPEKNTWKKTAENFLRRHRLNKAVKERKARKKATLEVLLQQLQEQAERERTRKQVPSTPAPPESYDHGIPEVLKKTRQKYIGEDGREYVFEHKLTVSQPNRT